MSKGSKTRAQEARLKAKRAAKAAAKQLYASYRDAGITKGSKRGLTKAKNAVKLVKPFKHVDRCYNVGCQECFPKLPPAPRANAGFKGLDA